MHADANEQRYQLHHNPPELSIPSRAPKRPRNASDLSPDDHHASVAPDDPSSTSRKTHTKKQPLSCAECRRLKLKCDRVFPCQSCSKRGCAEICPDGALTSGKGSRFILANTEQLHAKIIQMSDRIRQLEDALESVQAKCTNDPHPLLNQDLLRIKNALELYSSQVTPRCGDTPVDDSHASTSQLPSADRSPKEQDFGPIHRSEERGCSTDASPQPAQVPQLSAEIEKLSQAFPFPWLPNNTVRERIHEMLPPRSEAEYLCSQARSNALWQYNLDPSETWLPNLVHHVYATPVESLNFRRLSLLFIMMSIGLLVDLNQQKESPRAEVYHRLARASLCEMNLMDEPSLDLLQTLFYMIWYLLIFSDKSQAVAYAWSIMGLTVKLAQSLGLHRDGNRRKTIPEESQRRQMLFWELLNLDARLALSLGRPPSICLSHVDCHQPSYAVEGMFIVPGAQSYHQWKHEFFLECLTPVLTAAISAKQQPYRVVMEVDKKIRNFNIPPTLDIFHSDGVIGNRQLTMQQVLVSSGREIVLLQLHRNFFTEALSNPDTFSYQHQYAPSALATYLSASKLVATLDQMLQREPQLSKRFMCFWFNAFSGAVALSLIVSRTPFITLAPFALRELEEVHRLFAKVAEECSKVAQALPLLEKIIERSRRSYNQWRISVSRSSAMDVDDAAGWRGHSGRGTNPFDVAHPHLLECLEDISKTAPPPIQEVPIPTSRSMVALWSPGERTADQGNRSPEFSSESSTPGGTAAQRVGNHTFNFDFGALASNLENQSNTYMSWF
ncbi:fungal-specific transcription factor domain-containing protein, partial [Hygrophoropsis aurantiaca]